MHKKPSAFNSMTELLQDKITEILIAIENAATDLEGISEDADSSLDQILNEVGRIQEETDQGTLQPTYRPQMKPYLEDVVNILGNDDITTLLSDKIEALEDVITEIESDGSVTNNAPISYVDPYEDENGDEHKGANDDKEDEDDFELEEIDSPADESSYEDLDMESDDDTPDDDLSPENDSSDDTSYEFVDSNDDDADLVEIEEEDDDSFTEVEIENPQDEIDVLDSELNNLETVYEIINGTGDDDEEDLEEEEESEDEDEDEDWDWLFEPSPRIAENAEVGDEERARLLKYVPAGETAFLKDNEIVRLAIDYVDYAENGKEIDDLSDGAKERMFGGQDYIHGVNPSMLSTATKLDFIGIFNFLYNIKKEPDATKSQLTGDVMKAGFKYDPKTETWDYPDQIVICIPTPVEIKKKEKTEKAQREEKEDRRSKRGSLFERELEAMDHTPAEKGQGVTPEAAKEKIMASSQPASQGVVYTAVNKPLRSLDISVDPEMINTFRKAGGQLDKIIRRAEDSSRERMYVILQSSSMNFLRSIAKYVGEKIVSAHEKDHLSLVYSTPLELYSVHEIKKDQVLIVEAYSEKEEYRDHLEKLLLDIINTRYVIIIGRKKEIDQYSNSLKYVYKDLVTLAGYNKESMIDIYMRHLPQEIAQTITEENKASIGEYFETANKAFELGGEELTIFAAMVSVDARKFTIPSPIPVPKENKQDHVNNQRRWSQNKFRN